MLAGCDTVRHKRPARAIAITTQIRRKAPCQRIDAQRYNFLVQEQIPAPVRALFFSTMRKSSICMCIKRRQELQIILNFPIGINGITIKSALSINFDDVLVCKLWLEIGYMGNKRDF